MIAEASAMRRTLAIAALIIAGEAIFSSPFHITRFFRPTFLDVFDLSNTQLGSAQAAYGIVAMVSYPLGGPLADRLPARSLLTLALVATGVGGCYLLSIPDYWGLVWLYAFWGCSTILLFWSALIRATREWGGTTQQGRAFGLLDAGRGLLAAIIASAAVMVFSTLRAPAAHSGQAQEQALQGIIGGYIVLTLLAAWLTWCWIPSPLRRPSNMTNWRRHCEQQRTEQQWLCVLRLPALWLNALIVVCAYVAYKGIDTYGLYAVEVYGFGETEAAVLSAAGSWARPVAALAAGLLADRWGGTRMVVVCFTCLLAGYLGLLFSRPAEGAVWLLYANILATCAAIFGLRGIYFALFNEAKIPLALTGLAAGLISFVGYSPDIFVAPLVGRLLDAYPGPAGHFLVLKVFALNAVAGLLLSVLLHHLLASSGREPTLRGSD